MSTYFEVLEPKLKTVQLRESLRTNNSGSSESITAIHINNSKPNTDLNKYLVYKPEEKYLLKTNSLALSDEIKSHIDSFK